MSTHAYTLGTQDMCYVDTRTQPHGHVTHIHTVHERKPGMHTHAPHLSAAAFHSTSPYRTPGNKAPGREGLPGLSGSSGQQGDETVFRPHKMDPWAALSFLCGYREGWGRPKDLAASPCCISPFAWGVLGAMSLRNISQQLLESVRVSLGGTWTSNP